MRFAVGEQLRRIQVEVIKTWKSVIKTVIHNNLEWPVAHLGLKENIGGVSRNIIWERILGDAGRLQRLMYGQSEKIPGENIIEAFYPRLQAARSLNDINSKPHRSSR